MVGEEALLVSALIISIILFSGCTQPADQSSLVESGKTMFVCPSGDLVSNPDLCPSVEAAASTQSQVGEPQMESCPYECCYQEEGYYNKVCPGKQLCQNNKCVKQVCPYECCDGQDYDFKGCQTGKTCQDNTCIQTNCPFECCDGTTYSKKDCSANKECINNNCEIKECPYACCPGSFYKEKECLTNYQCLGNECVEIPKPALQVNVIGCSTGINILQGLGEVTNLVVTIKNYGTASATNVVLDATANDEEQDIPESQIVVGTIVSSAEIAAKLLVDTDSTTPTTMTLNVTSNESAAYQTSTSNCHYDPDEILGQLGNLAKYAALFGV